MLDNALAKLRADFEAGEKGKQFDKLKVFLTGESAVPRYGQLATELAISEGAVKVAVHRLRQRFVGCPTALVSQLRAILLERGTRYQKGGGFWRGVL